MSVYAGSEDGFVYGLNASPLESNYGAFETGLLCVPCPDSGSRRGLRAVGHRSTYTRSDAENGELLWSSEFESPVDASPVMKDGKVDISLENGYVYALFAHGLEASRRSPRHRRGHSLSDLREGLVVLAVSDRSRRLVFHSAG